MDVQERPTLWVAKIGGAIMDMPDALQRFLKTFSALNGPRVLVHGGGKQATDLAERMGISVKMVKGRRITDREMLDVVTMVYGGLVNKTIVARLNGLGTPAVGLTGADNQLILAHRRPPTPIDFGFVGDIDRVNYTFLYHLLEQKITPVIAPLTVTAEGQLLNTNADTIATEVAIALTQSFTVHLVLCLDRPGVLRNAEDPDSVIPVLSFADYQQLKYQGHIHSGMIPKLDNAFRALNLGVREVRVCHFNQFAAVTEGQPAGTQLKR